ncbi:hypothetical protein EG329_008225 [Mollisiaceae sp. DMI_Dod_QoI]|nr:hypothetical protein EG329_008225 [Helotiales sp. DMI_Dod_QoI]
MAGPKNIKAAVTAKSGKKKVGRPKKAHTTPEVVIEQQEQEPDEHEEEGEDHDEDEEQNEDEEPDEEEEDTGSGQEEEQDKYKSIYVLRMVSSSEKMGCLSSLDRNGMVSYGEFQVDGKVHRRRRSDSGA